jgi:hypothetical protein
MSRQALTIRVALSQRVGQPSKLKDGGYKMQDSMSNAKVQQIIPMPIKGRPYKHQIRAFNFICSLFGLLKGGGVPAISGWGAALLMEMG